MADQNKELVFRDERGVVCTPDDFGDLLDKFMQDTGQFHVTDQHGTRYFASPTSTELGTSSAPK